jgi:hypothetical protein
MNVKKRVQHLIRGWLPKETNLAYAKKEPKPRWRNPFWITFTVVVVVALTAVAFAGVSILARYVNSAMDVAPSPYYEKTANSTTASVGDIVEVSVWVHWHGYVLPEFKRNVKVVDPFPESYFSLASENESNVYQSQGYGGTYQLRYLLRADGGEGVPIELPKPRLYLDDVEIPLTGENPTVNILAR